MLNSSKKKRRVGFPKIGILGGGQLGRMLLQAAANYPVETFVLENDPACPAAHLCHHFSTGDIRNYDDVLAFGQDLDALTIEIENVNTRALEKLESLGVKIYPKPSVLKIIKNKIQQKEYYKQHNIPTADFRVTNDFTDLSNAEEFLPAVQKIGEGGYDGRGVQVINTRADFSNGFDSPSILEKMIAIQKEIAVIVAINKKGETALYPPVEMIFDKELNQLDYQVCPAFLDNNTLFAIQKIATATAKNFNSPGLFAIELFIDQGGEVLVNETAPRVHNSGHHTIEAHYCSQFDMLWRIMLGYPLGNTTAILPSMMVNIVGSEGFSGEVKYEGLKEILSISNSFVHLYGKRQTKPGRKMGHVTVLDNDNPNWQELSNKVKKTLLAKS